MQVLFQAFAHIYFSIIPLANTSHVVKPRANAGGQNQRGQYKLEPLMQSIHHNNQPISRHWQLELNYKCIYFLINSRLATDAWKENIQLRNTCSKVIKEIKTIQILAAHFYLLRFKNAMLEIQVRYFKKILLTMGVVKHWNGLVEETVIIFPFKVLKFRLATQLSGMYSWTEAER